MHYTLKCVSLLYVILLQHSWKWYIYYRCQNVNRERSGSVAGPSPKKLKVKNASHYYTPPTNGGDDVSYQQNIELFKIETAKARPRIDVIKSLLP